MTLIERAKEYWGRGDHEKAMMIVIPVMSWCCFWVMITVIFNAELILLITMGVPFMIAMISGLLYSLVKLILM